MTDTPKIDWSKPVEACLNGEWREVEAVMRDHGGSIHHNGLGWSSIFWAGASWTVRTSQIRNKPEPLECFLNVGPHGEIYCHASSIAAANCAIPGSRRIAVRMVEAERLPVEG